MKQYILSALIAVFAQVGLADESSLNNFIFKSYPVTEGNCEASAQDLAVRFSAETGRQIMSVRCEEAGYEEGGFDIDVKYIGTIISDDPNVQDHLYGGYSNESSCIADLDTQKNLFTVSTSLAVFEGYCSPGGYLYIYSLNNPEATRRSFKSTLRGQFTSIGDIVLDDTEGIQRQLSDVISGLGGSSSRVKVKGNGDVYIYYYAPEKLNVMFVQHTGYKTSDECESEKPTVANLVSTFHGSTLLQICAPTAEYPMPGAELFNFVVYPYPFMFSQVYTLHMEDVGARYQSLNHCNADKSRVYSIYRNQLGKEVYGSNCTYDDDSSKYRMLIFRTAEL